MDMVSLGIKSTNDTIMFYTLVIYSSVPCNCSGISCACIWAIQELYTQWSSLIGNKSVYFPTIVITPMHINIDTLIDSKQETYKVGSHVTRF